MINFNKNSIATKLSIVMLLVIIIQTIILAGGILSSNVVSNLSDNAYEAFSKNVENRKNYLITEMKLNFSNIIGYAYDIITKYEEMAQPNSVLDDKDIDDFLVSTTSELVTMLRSTITTGAFVILDNDGTNDTHSVIYLKDEDPEFNNQFDSDIYMLKGPVEVLRALKTPLHSMWNYGITLDENDRDIFHKPIEASSKSDDFGLLGYWQVSPTLEENDMSMVSYSLPLIEKNGKAFGVLGVEITQDYFYKMLPDNEIYGNSSLGYMLAINDKNTGKITPMLMQGAIQSTIASIGVPLELEVENEKQNVYKILNTNSDFPVLCSVGNLDLYDSNMPFQNEQWVLIGLVEEKELLSATKNFLNTLYIAFSISITLGVLMIFWVGLKFTQPIVLLAKKVRINDYKIVVSLDKTGYSEIDDLSIAIKESNQKILDAVLKTDKIIHMVNLSLGTFEYRKGSNFVVCSTALLRLLNIPDESELTATIDSQLFFQKIEKIKENIEDEKNSIYILSKDPAQWIKLVSVEHENSVLGIGMDVTKEVLDSHAIKFERDYDDLTKLLNRFAFRRNLKEIFQQGVKQISAFVLFDLDNLKYINDTYGHDMGDICISSTAQILSCNLQDRCLVGRMSGDEFYVFLYGFETKDAVRKQLNAIYTSLDHNLLTLPTGNKLKIRISGGIAWYGEDSYSLEELISFADFAMYQGKHTLKGEIREFDKETFTRESFMLSGKEELNRVLDNQLFDYAFQPIVSAKTGELYAYESLMRPQSEILNSPIKLIQIATSQSQLWKIEKITFFKTLSLYMKYRELFDDCKIFINSVPNESLTDSDYLELEKLYPDILKNIVIEIIENEKLDINTLAKKRIMVEKWGGAIALDDYGSGYNGDISLLSLSPQIVKIDRLMIEGIESDKNRQSIVQKLLVYAKEQNIFVLAEGVETSSQMDFLVRAGVDYLQGFYISKPRFIPDFNNEAIAKEIQAIHGISV